VPRMRARQGALLLTALFASLCSQICLAEPSTDVPRQLGFISAEFIYEKAPFPSCHASTIVEIPGKKLVVAWFGGTDEGQTDVGIWISRRDGTTWSVPEEVATGVDEMEKRFPCWNPVLFRIPDGPLLLFYKVGPSPSRWWGMLKRSSDEGVTWSAAE